MKKLTKLFSALFVATLSFVIVGCAAKTTTEQAATTTKQQVTTTKENVTTTEAPVTTTEAPVTTTEAPGTTTKDPITTTEAPGTTTEAPVTTTEPPVVINRGTEENPLTVSQIIAEIDKNNGATDTVDSYVTGEVISASYYSKNDNYTIIIKDANNQELKLYSCTSTVTFKIGSTVVAKGKTTKYNESYQLNSGCSVLSATDVQIVTKFGSHDAPVSVADAIESTKAYVKQSTDYAYVTGFVTKIDSKNYSIADTASGTTTLLVYFPTAPEGVAVGDKIVVSGKYQYFGTTPEVTSSRLHKFSEVVWGAWTENEGEYTITAQEKCSCGSTKDLSGIEVSHQVTQERSFENPEQVTYKAYVMVNGTKYDATNKVVDTKAAFVAFELNETVDTIWVNHKAQYTVKDASDYQFEYAVSNTNAEIVDNNYVKGLVDGTTKLTITVKDTNGFVIGYASKDITIHQPTQEELDTNVSDTEWNIGK